MPFHFHFTQDIDAAQIQLFAKVVKCMLDDEFSMKNAQWVDCAMPQEAQNLQQLQDICDSGQIGSHFQITTSRYEGLDYVTKRSQQIPNLDASLHLSALQPQFYAFKADKIQLPYVDLVDWLLASFVFINTDLTNYFFNRAYEDGSFNWNDKYGPCFLTVTDSRWCGTGLLA